MKVKHNVNGKIQEPKVDEEKSKLITELKIRQFKDELAELISTYSNDVGIGVIYSELAFQIKVTEFNLNLVLANNARNKMNK